MGASRFIDGMPNIVLIGLPNLKALQKARGKLIEAGIEHSEWTEPDFDLGFTSMATEPLDAEKKQVLANYRLWRPMIPGSSEKEQTATHKVAGRSHVQVVPGEPILCDPVAQ